MPKESRYLTKSGLEILVREAKDEDFPKIWTIYRNVLREGEYTSGIRGEMTLERYEYCPQDEGRKRVFITVVAEVGGQVVGYVTVEESPWELSHHVGELGIAILPDHRAIGIGTALLDSALRMASRKDFKKISLGVFHTNLRAISLYRKFGFKRVGRKKRQFKLNDRYIDEVIMERSIDKADW